MRFGEPQLLWAVWILPLFLSLFLWWTLRRKQQIARRFISERLWTQLTAGISKGRIRLKSSLLILSLALLCLALARPQWGYTEEEVTHQGLDILVAIDTSRSMLAQDIKPDRLTRAKLAALDLMKAAETDRMGLIAFAGTAFLQCPLTFDEEVFKQSVELLNTDILPHGGTALTEAIRVALDAIRSESQNHKILILFTDGEHHEEDMTDILAEAESEGLRVFTIGVGTPGGELLKQKDEDGNEVYIKDAAGNVVQSRLNEALLLQVATETQGAYLPLRDSRTMQQLYELSLEPLPKSDIAAKMMRQYHERFQWPLAFAIVFLVLEALISERRRPKARSQRSHQESV